MKVVIRGNDYRSPAAYFTEEIEYKDDEHIVIETPTGTNTIARERVKHIDPEYTRSDWDYDYTSLDCPCGETATYMCDCGCPCCGEDPCAFSCGGSVSPLSRQRDHGLVPRLGTGDV